MTRHHRINRFTSWPVTIVLASLFALALPVAAEKTVAMAATADSYIDVNKPDDNKGSGVELKLKDFGHRSLARWDGLPAGATVTDVLMRFHATVGVPGRTVSVHRLTQSFVEGSGTPASGVDWNHWADPNAWTTPGGDYDPIAVGSFEPDAVGSYVVDEGAPEAIENLVQDWIDGVVPNAGVILLSSGALGDARLASRENPANPGLEPLLEITYITPADDISIDGAFDDWSNLGGTEYCIDDQGGADDWSSPAALDITRFCIATNSEDELYALFAFDDTALSGNTDSTACVLADTPPSDGNADYFFCVTIEGNPTTVKQIGAYSCDNDAVYECNNPTPIPGFATNFGFSNTVPGVFGGADSMVELEIPWADIGLSGGDIVFTALITYPGQSALNGDLNSPKDSILGGIDASGNPYQDYTSKISYDSLTGEAATTPITLAHFESSGGRGAVSFEWTTAAEASNVGFNLYALEDDELRRLNSELIPSLEGDSIRPQHYRFDAYGVGGTQFVLEDVDINGDVRHHGPFTLGESHGSRSLAQRPTDWQLIRERQRARRATRYAHGRGMSRRARYSPVAELLVDRTGVVRVSHEDLLAAGLDFSGTPLRHLAVTNRGRQIPIRVHGRGVFGPGAFIEFVGEGLESLYSRSNVYTLRVVRGYVLRTAVDRSSPRRRASSTYRADRKIEQNRAYSFASPIGDPWYDQRLLAYSGPAEHELALDLDGYVPGAGPVELSLTVWGVTDFPLTPDHHLIVAVNGVELADEWFDGLTERVIHLEIPQSILDPHGDNRIRLTLPGDTRAKYDLVHYDHYRVSYPRRLIAGADGLHFEGRAASHRVAGLDSSEVVVYKKNGRSLALLDNTVVGGVPGSYSVTFAGDDETSTYVVATPSSLIRPEIRASRLIGTLTTLPAEYLVISHADFIEAIRPLVWQRRRQGLSARIVDVADVYRAYSHGIVDPMAIQRYVARSFAESGTKYVLLVGGDTYDYHDNLGLGSISFIPTPYAPTGPIVHFAPADPLLADVDGDLVPDLPIGRLPVRTVEELEAVVDKTLDYGRGATPKRALFAADTHDVATGYSFRAGSEKLRAQVPAGWTTSQVYLDDLTVDQARSSLLDEMSSGVSLVSYFGHSSSALWSTSQLLTTADVDELDNTGRPMIVAQWGCWNTYYVSPGYDTLSHELLLSADRGAAAVIGAATLTEADSELRLASALASHFTGPRATLGEALTRAKQELAAATPEALDVILGVTLLGDPALTVDP